MAFYAVKVGRSPGIYDTWNKCNKQVHGFKGAQYKKFSTMQEAESFINLETVSKSNGEVRETADTISISQSSKVDKPTLMIEEGHVVAYTDGSFKVSDNSYGYGAILIFPDGEEVELQGRGKEAHLVQLRNVAAELKAALQAIHYAISKGCKVIHIHHDYMGVSEWAEGRWKCKLPVTKGYLDTVNQFREKIDIRFTHVSAHTGDYYNEVADRLAAM